MLLKKKCAGVQVVVSFMFVHLFAKLHWGLFGVELHYAEVEVCFCAGWCQPGAKLHGGLGLPHNTRGHAEPTKLPPQDRLQWSCPDLYSLWRPIWQSPASSGTSHARAAFQSKQNVLGLQALTCEVLG